MNIKNTKSIILVLFFTLLFTQCENYVPVEDLGSPIGEANLGDPDNFIISGTIYDAETKEPMPGAKVGLSYPNSANITMSEQIQADKHGHYEFSGLKSWYKVKDEVGYENLVWQYLIGYNHYPVANIGGLGIDGEYFPDQNLYMKAGYYPLFYIDLDNQTDLTHITQNLYLPKINKDITVKAHLVWDDGSIVKKSSLSWIRVNPYIETPKDGRAADYTPEDFSYNESSGELAIGNQFANGKYSSIQVGIHVPEKDLNLMFDNPVNITSGYDFGELILDKQRGIFINLSNASDYNNMFLYYAVFYSENSDQPYNNPVKGQIEQGEYKEARENNVGYTIYSPGQTYYLQAYIDSVAYGDDWLNMKDGFNPILKTGLLPIEVNYDVFDVYYSLSLDDFSKN